MYTHVPDSSKFIELDLIEPSRYAIGINPQYRNPWDKIAFIAVDPENLNTPYYTPDFFEDHGDDVLPSYDRGSIRHGSAMVPQDGSDGDAAHKNESLLTSAVTDIPSTVLRFMKLKQDEGTGIPSAPAVIVEDVDDDDDVGDY